eukprot:gnl/TRDRNA2_/TRDRNA2_61591_c1_seq1.p1 gnl/TRDRNA2_/TRDRNA2_61591_c1~~gnl/TRDRNA2_/TRDRNA2_61591_c1_seq1.p1  ORF type:complete len:258 (-),score=35.37 gnl/TRDRNA2_/TRDRNA2_61591_c1_seq1:218-964(-)
MVVDVLQPNSGEEVRIQGVYTEYSGAFSGGTLASGRASREALKTGRITEAMNSDPYLLAPGTVGLDSSVGTRSGMPADFSRTFDSSYGTLMSFFMAPINASIVRRSLALRGLTKSCSYRECCSLNMWLRAAAKWSSRGFGYCVGQPINFNPKPGEGPPPWLLDAGAFTLYVTAATGDRSCTVEVRGNGDPGYGATSKMLAELGLCLSFDLGSAPTNTGLLTPSVALGKTLVERLNRSNKGTFMSFKVM